MAFVLSAQSGAVHLRIGLLYLLHTRRFNKVYFQS